MEGELTEEQAEAQLRAVRARRALSSAPELAYQLRWDATPLDGRTERGELPDLRTPLLTGITDAADELYAVLFVWVGHWATELEVAAPVAWAWRSQAGEVRGMRAETSPETASILVSSAAAWLLWHEDAIAEHRDAAAYQHDVATLTWQLRSAAGLIRSRRAPVEEFSTRACPVCGELQVRAEYFGEPMAAAAARGERLAPYALAGESDVEANNAYAAAIAGVAVKCAHCGWEPPLRASKIARWLS